MDQNQRRIPVPVGRVATMHLLLNATGVERSSPRPQARVDQEVRRRKEESQNPRGILLLAIQRTAAPRQTFLTRTPMVCPIVGSTLCPGDTRPPDGRSSPRPHVPIQNDDPHHNQEWAERIGKEAHRISFEQPMCQAGARQEVHRRSSTRAIGWRQGRRSASVSSDALRGDMPRRGPTAKGRCINGSVHRENEC